MNYVVDATNLQTLNQNKCSALKIHRHTQNAFHRELVARFFLESNKMAVKLAGTHIIWLCMPEYKWTTFSANRDFEQWTSCGLHEKYDRKMLRKGKCQASTINSTKRNEPRLTHKEFLMSSNKCGQRDKINLSLCEKHVHFNPTDSKFGVNESIFTKTHFLWLFIAILNEE